MTALSPIDVVQLKLSQDLDQRVIAELSTSNTDGIWTFLVGRPTSADGEDIEYSKTQYADDWAEGYFDDVFVALVKSVKSVSGVNDTLYTLVAYDLGSTDASFVDWPELYGVSADLVMLR